MDNKKTKEVDTRKTLINKAFKDAIATLQTKKSWKWEDYKDTYTGHWAKIEAFNKPVKVGGYKFAVNAISQQHGPSWRMVVSLEKPIKAWGNYPGGQSGNVGSKNFDEQVEPWAKGEYFRLNFLANINDRTGIVKQQTFVP